MKLIYSLLAVVLAGTCMTAFAQWQWVDKDGHKVFSDRAPPPDVLDKNIVKRPAGRIPNVAPVSETPGAEAALVASPAASAPKLSGLDKELEAKKKQAVDAEVLNRKIEEERIMKARIENCARAKQAKATLDLGMPIARANKAGERELMDDASRNAEIKRIQGIITTDCK